MTSWRKSKKKEGPSNNRINLVLAIVFLFGAALIGRLFYIQVYKHGYYLEVADNQHTSTKLLESERGRIFIKDKNETGNDTYYPLATNKDFAIVYAVPEDIDNPELRARQIFFAFDRERVYGDIDKKYEEIIKEMEKQASSTDPKPITKEEKEILDEKKDIEKKNQRNKIVGNYQDKFSNKSDKYERIAVKIDDVGLKKMYAFLESDPEQFYPDDEGNDKNIKADPDLYYLKNNVMYKKNAKDGKDAIWDIEGFGYTMQTYRYYPENNVGSNILGFVSYENDKAKGNYGLEEFFDDELSGTAGSVTAGRGAGGALIIVNNREYTKPMNGSDLLLTIDRSIQYITCTKLDEAVLRHGADSGSAIVMDPQTGAILAMCSSPNFDPNNYSEAEKISDFNNLAIFDQYEPGSIFKVLTMAMGLDQGKITPDSTYEDTGSVKIAGYNIQNSDKLAHGVQTMTQVLEQSLNTGVIHVVKKIGLDTFESYVDNFGFGERSGIELGGEAKGYTGNLNDKMHKELNTYTASFGQGISVTALQMVTAFNAIANGGMMMKPYIVQEIVHENGEKIETQPKEIRRVISEKSASLLGAMMVNVVENGHGKMAGVSGYYIAGKTGTAQVPRKDGRGYQDGVNIGSFAGFGPAEEPVFTMIVRIDHPRDVAWAESSAAPLFGEIAKFILDYKQVAPSRNAVNK